MTEFILYKSNGISLKKIEIINRIIASSIGLFLPLSGAIPIMVAKFGLTSIVGISVIVIYFLSVVILFVFSGYATKKLKIYGYITVSKNALTKTINGLKQTYHYGSIKKIVLRNHINSFFFPSNSDSSRSYLVTILYTDGKNEKLVVSSQSKNNPGMNFLNVLKQIEKYGIKSPKIIKKKYLTMI